MGISKFSQIVNKLYTFSTCLWAWWVLPLEIYLQSPILDFRRVKSTINLRNNWSICWKLGVKGGDYFQVSNTSLSLFVQLDLNNPLELGFFYFSGLHLLLQSFYFLFPASNLSIQGSDNIVFLAKALFKLLCVLVQSLSEFHALNLSVAMGTILVLASCLH